jgi:hypothetical protein
MQRLLNGPLKGVVARQARQQTAAKVRPEHYPAPFAIIDIWARHGGNALAVPADRRRRWRRSSARPPPRTWCGCSTCRSA